MAYTINLANGSVLTTVENGTVDTNSTSLRLVGKNYTGYGELQNENYVWLLENFSRDIPPSNPIAGQCWWDTSSSVLNVYTGTVFKSISSSTVSDTPPPTGVDGDLWWNSLDKQLYVNDDGTWVLIGPSYTGNMGQSGIIVEIIQDTGANDHVIVSMYVAETRISVFSRDAEFLASPGLTGYTTIAPGLNIINESVVTGVKITGTSTNSDKLGEIDAATYLRGDQDAVIDGTLTLAVESASAIKLGYDNNDESKFHIGMTGSTASILNTANASTIKLGSQNSNGQDVWALVFNPDNQNPLSVVNNRISDLIDPVEWQDASTKQYLFTTIDDPARHILKDNGDAPIIGIILPDITDTHDFGSDIKRYATIYATEFNGVATTAQYADLAERFEADDSYVAGTVVALGGDKEITQVDDDLSDSVFGVISTQPAHLMNAAAGPNETHPPIAMQGRVPVRVIGQVRKGDRLVSAGGGLARAGKPEEITAFNIVGRSLENKYTETQGVVEATVSMNT